MIGLFHHRLNSRPASSPLMDLSIFGYMASHRRKGDKIGAALNLKGARPRSHPFPFVPREVGADISTMNRARSVCEKRE
jgi:hypothetical protein